MLDNYIIMPRISLNSLLYKNQLKHCETTSLGESKDDCKISTFDCVQFV